MRKNEVIIIAEAGVNHNGDLNLAFKLIDEAAKANVDFVKFQTFKTELLVQENAKKAAYQIENTGNDDSQFAMLKKLEIPMEWYPSLIARCEQKGVKFLSTGFDEASLDFLDSIGIELYKIPSGELTNRPYLEHIASKGKPVVLSTGMATIDEIKACLLILTDGEINRNDIIVLHCNTQYPTPMRDVNLKAMRDIQEQLNVKIGYSDHTLGIEVPIAAVALGARLIEKHFTLDKTMEGPDHAASLEPHELQAMVNSIRNIEEAIAGSGLKEPSVSEIQNKVAARKSIHLESNLREGTILTKDDLIMLRPGDGISPMDIHSVIGKKLTANLSERHKLKWTDLS